MPCRLSNPLAVIALLLALAGTSRAEITPADAPFVHLATATEATCNANGHYSVLRTRRLDCVAHDSPKAVEARNWEPINVNVLQAEIFAFAIIGVTQVRGGTRLLSDVWYAGAVLVPPFMEKHPDHGMALNYAAITPPFIALGLMNGYLHRVDALEPRIFLSNFIGFNLGLLWSHHILESPQRERSATPTRRVNSFLFPLPEGDGAGVLLSLQW